MKIEIFETGFPKCKILEANAQKALKETGKNAELVKFTEIGKVVELGVMSSSAIVIDGEVKSYGKLDRVTI